MFKATSNTKALSGLKVLDLSRFIAGPHCAMLLGDLGAEIVKVERKERGDDVRAIEPRLGGESIYFMVFNRSKRGMTLDFRDKHAQALLRDLIKQADVLVENFRPGTMEKMGLSWEEVHALNPRLVMARVSGYGQNNSMSSTPCFDGIAQALSGLMDMTGAPEGPPTMSGSFIVDYTTALYAAVGILAALQQRQVTGEGQMVDASLMASATSLLMTAIPETLALGNTMSRVGNRDRYSAPAQTFQAADGRWVHVIAGNSVHFPRFVGMIGQAELLDDPRFNSHGARMQNQAAVEKIVSDWIASLSSEEAVTLLSDADIAAARVATVEEVANSPYMREAGNIIDVPHATAGSVPMQGVPIRLSASDNAVDRGAPLLGADTDAILRDWLDLSPDQIKLLRNQDIF